MVTIADLSSLPPEVFETLLPAMINLDDLAKDLDVHSVAGHFYDVEKQPIYRAATIVLARWAPHLLGITKGDNNANGQ